VRPSDLAARDGRWTRRPDAHLQPLIEHGWAEIGPGIDGRSRLVAPHRAGRAKRTEAQRAWKRAQLALNEQLRQRRVAELHVLLDDCLAALSTDAEEKAPMPDAPGPSPHGCNDRRSRLARPARGRRRVRRHDGRTHSRWACS
jgi:hypothetical protein